jgi:uncharacterized membrane protein YfcA
MTFNIMQLVLVGLAAVAAGLVNALAGGGTLITFPMLTFVGVGTVSANVTNTVALCPGYLGATLAQFKDLKDQKSRLKWILPASVMGGLVGAFLLLNTGERLFRNLVPYLILAASLLLAIQDPVKAWLQRRAQRAGATQLSEKWAALPVGLAAIYGGYFGAGMSVIVLAVLGLVLNDSLTRLNAIKQSVAFSVNTAAALFFIFFNFMVSKQIQWEAVAVMMVGALAGGSLGGRLAGKIQPTILRWIVVTIGVIVAIVYFIKG